MCLLGFGFLYAFLRRYSLSALGLTYLLSCIVMVEAALVVGAFQQVGCLCGPEPLPFALEALKCCT